MAGRDRRRDLATGAAGPRRLRYGTPRDLLIGITVVRADGTVARSGGKVVKNVAGYDLGKLFTGSFGTLGLIVEAVFRLHPRPASAAYVTVDCAARTRRTGRSPPQRAASWHRRPSNLTARHETSRCGWPCWWRGTRRHGGTDRLMCALLGKGAAARPSAPGWWGWLRTARPVQ